MKHKSLHKKTCLRGLQPDPTQARAVQPQKMVSLETTDIENSSRYCSFLCSNYKDAVAQLIRDFVFAYKSRFSSRHSSHLRPFNVFQERR